MKTERIGVYTSVYGLAEWASRWGEKLKPVSYWRLCGELFFDAHITADRLQSSTVGRTFLPLCQRCSVVCMEPPGRFKPEATFFWARQIKRTLGRRTDLVHLVLSVRFSTHPGAARPTGQSNCSTCSVVICLLRSSQASWVPVCCYA